MADSVLLRGLRARGVHGALPEEQSRAQPFQVDLDINVDLRAAGISDNLADTVDYGQVAEAVVKVVETEHHQLLERLAERVALTVLDWPTVTSVTVEVRKLRPPVPVEMDTAAVRITRP